MKFHNLFVGLAFAQGLVGSQSFAQTEPSRALERCETAVAETVKRMRGAAAKELQFVAAKRSVVPAQDDETSVRGEGRYSSRAGGANAFTYSCAYNAKAGTTSGVMFRETGSDRTPAEPVWQPDLTFVSPEACEGASAADLKQKYPRVVRIAFDSDSRQLSAAADTNTSLEGQGAVQRAPGMQTVPFNYRCEIDTRSGRILSVQTTP
ncbi:MAG: hypothetical protein WA210_14610 [Burkholderiaceae bacterium]